MSNLGEFWARRCLLAVTSTLLPLYFFHVALFSCLGVIRPVLSKAWKWIRVSTTRIVRCWRKIIGLYKRSANGWYSFLDPGVPLLSNSGFYFLWCPMSNTWIKWYITSQPLCNGALQHGGVAYSPQLVCALGVSSRLQLRPDTREDSSEGQISVLVTRDTI